MHESFKSKQRSKKVFTAQKPKQLTVSGFFHFVTVVVLIFWLIRMVTLGIVHESKVKHQIAFFLKKDLAAKKSS